MFWLAEEEFAATVPLSWERTAADAPENAAKEAAETATDKVRMEDAVWRQKGQAHYLTFKDPSDASANSSTVLRLSSDTLVWTRFGDVTWNHTFSAGQSAASILRMSGFSMDVRTRTHHLDVQVGPDGGRIDLSYRMEAGGAEQEVHLHLRFGGEATL